MTAAPFQKGWKLLRTTRRSYMVLGISGRDYPKNCRVFPEEGTGPLTVFSTKHRANRFADSNPISEPGTHLVVPCLFKPSRETRVWTVLVPKGRALGYLPLGTLLAEHVTCLE